MKKTSLAFTLIGMAALLGQSTSAQVLFTTTNDFGLWQTANNFTQGPVVSPDSDGSTINGLGMTNGVGQTGTGGALSVQWPQGGTAYNYATGTPGEQGYTNFIAALEQTNKVFTFDYTTPGTNGTYFNLGIVVNCQGRFDQLFPTSTRALGGGWTRATIDWSTEATNLINQAVINKTSSTNVPPIDFTYFQLEVIYNSDYNPTIPFYVDNFTISNPSPPPFKLFTTTNDFAGWTTEPDSSSVGPTNLDLDGPPGGATNGIGNLTAPGAVGPTGALSIVWASNTFGVASYSPYETSNTAFIASMLQAASVSFDYTTPPAGTGTYFEVGIVVDCQGRFDELFPSTPAVALSNGISRATIDWVSEAQALAAQKVVNTNTFTYFRIGVVWNSDYAPGGVPFQVDNFTAVTNPPAAYVIPSGATIAAENCTVPNGAIDPGETVTVNFGLQNTGNASLSNVTATLQSTGGVILPSGTQSYGTLLANGGAATNAYTFTAGGTCGGSLVATLQLQTNSVFYRTVPYSFTLGGLLPPLTNTYSSGAEAIAIPDNNPVGITNSITVTATGAVAHVTVSVRINHTFDGDLQFFLIHPDGTQVGLKQSDEGATGTGQNFGSGATDCTGTFTIFDDSGPTPIAAGTAPFTAGPYKPRQVLSALNGKPAQGTWKLYVADVGPGDVGTLYCAQLQIAYQPFACCSGFVTPTDPYTTWENHYFPSGGPNAAGGADPDHDGVSNTNEFLAGFNPTNSAAYPHVIAIARQGGDMNVTYLGANGDSTWSPGIASRTNVLEFSTGVAGTGNYSNNFASANVTNILSGGTGVGVVTNMVDPGGATGKTRYYRIRILAP